MHTFQLVLNADRDDNKVKEDAPSTVTILLENVYIGLVALVNRYLKVHNLQSN